MILIKDMNFSLLLKTKKNRKMKTKCEVSEKFEKKWIYLNYMAKKYSNKLSLKEIKFAHKECKI